MTSSPLWPLIWSLLRLVERKIAKMVAVRWPRWSPCPYMVKSFKNLLFQNQGFLGAESLHKSSVTGGLPKILKWWSYIDVWPFDGKVEVASLCVCMGPIHLYEKCWKFQTTSPLKSPGQCCSNFMLNLLGAGERNIAKMVAVRWPRWPPCPSMVKAFESFSKTK